MRRRENEGRVVPHPKQSNPTSNQARALVDNPMPGEMYDIEELPRVQAPIDEERKRVITESMRKWLRE